MNPRVTGKPDRVPDGLTPAERAAFDGWAAADQAASQAKATVVIRVEGSLGTRRVVWHVYRGRASRISNLRYLGTWDATEGVWTRPGCGPRHCPTPERAMELFLAAVADRGRQVRPGGRPSGASARQPYRSGPPLAFGKKRVGQRDE